MTEDILLYFPLNTKNVRYGLFKKPLSGRKYTGGISNRLYGVNGTYYADALKISIGEDYTLLDMFHGYCLPYAKYFTEKNPDWEIMELQKYHTYKRINHVFAVKHLKDGRTLFADARGITDDVLEFFEDFVMSKKTMKVFPLRIETNCYPISKQLFENAYKKIYTNRVPKFE